MSLKKLGCIGVTEVWSCGLSELHILGVKFGVLGIMMPLVIFVRISRVTNASNDDTRKPITQTRCLHLKAKSPSPDTVLYLIRS
jgi:hypothetical protein